MNYNKQLRIVGLAVTALSLVGCATPPTRAYPLSSSNAPISESVAEQDPFVEFLFRPNQCNGLVTTAIDGNPVQFKPKYNWFTREIIEPHIAYQAFAPPGRHLISFRRSYYEAPYAGLGFKWVGNPPLDDLSSPEQTVEVDMRPGHFYRLTEEIRKGRLNVGWAKNSRTSEYIFTISEYEKTSGARLSTVTNVSLTFTSGIDNGRGFNKWIVTPAK